MADGLLFKPEEFSSTEQELQKKWKTRKGQVWSIGDHSLVIGSATSIRFERGEGICTDPPFGMRVEELIAIFNKFAKVAVVLCDDRMAFDLDKHWRMRIDRIWVHNFPKWSVNRRMPIYYHAHVVVYTKTESIPTGWTSKNSNSVIKVDGKPSKKMFGWGSNFGKPVRLFEEMLKGFEWKTFVDPFVGTGTSFIAAESLGKVCYGVEIDPVAAAIALERVTLYGLPKPKLLKA